MMRFSYVVSAGLGYHIPRLFESESSFAEFRNAVRLLKQQGFSGVELNLPFADEHVLLGIGRILHEEQFPLAAVGTGLIYVERGLSFTDPDSAKREKALATVKRLARFASEERAVLIIGMVRGGRPDGDKRVEFLPQSLAECDKLASELGIRIALEAINRYETSLLNTAAEVAQLIHDEALSATGMHLDTFHMNIEEPSIEATLREYHARISHFHIADSNRWPPGHGHLHVEEQLRLIEGLGYRGWASGEVIPKPDNVNAVVDTANFLRTHNFIRNS
jgi:sugar phosphate isomerase/epimerase